MGFKVPSMNLWGRAWKPAATGDQLADQSWLFMGYFRCQLRTTDNHYAEHFTLEVPKYTGFYPYDQTVFALGMRVQLAGWEAMWAKVLFVCDVGAGFSNEHRSITCTRPFDTNWLAPDGCFMPAVDPTLAPPDGFTPMPLTLPADFWQEPNMDNGWRQPPGFGPFSPP